MGTVPIKLPRFKLMGTVPIKLIGTVPIKLSRFDLIAYSSFMTA